MTLANIAQMSVEELIKLNPALATLLAQKDQVIKHRDLKIAQLTHEMATLKRWTFGKKSEQVTGLQRSLLEESIEEDIEAISIELEELQSPAPDRPKGTPKRLALPKELPRIEIRHEPESAVCGCGCALKRIGEDVSEKLDYLPGVMRVERHIRGKWVCDRCETLTQAPVPPQVIDKGIPTAALVAQVLVGKYADHQPLYRMEEIFGRAGFPIPRSTQSQWVGASGVKLTPLYDAMKTLLLKRSVLHADETPVPMLKPGLKRTHRSYLWAYGTTAFDPEQMVVYDFAEGRGGEHARTFLGQWKGALVCDDYQGYDALFRDGVTEVGCLAHARRKFHALHENQRIEIAAEALDLYGALYGVEREAQELNLDAERRRELRQVKARPSADALHTWLERQLAQVPEGSATAKAILYSLRRWTALTRYLDDGNLPIDNNWVENRIRPIALGRSNWLFAGSARAGRRAAVIMSLIQSARLNGHDPYAYLRDVLERLPLTPNNRLEELLPHALKPADTPRVH
jgi:transposase